MAIWNVAVGRRIVVAVKHGPHAAKEGLAMPGNETPRLMHSLVSSLVAAAAVALLSAPAGAVTAVVLAFAPDGIQIAQADPRQADQAVRAAQQALAAMRIDPGPIDGVMGPKTRDAIRAFQNQRRLAPSGELDANTRVALGIR